MTAEDIRARIAELIGENGQLRAILKRITEGRADFSDTMQYAIVSGRIMGKELSSVILELAEGRPEIARQLLRDRYDDINDLCDQVQTALDAKQGLHLRPQKAPFPAERVKQITDSLTDPTASDDTIRRRARSSANIAASFHDDYIKANADFRSKAGLQCYITRETDGKCCPWCTDLAGHYRYPEDIPESIFQRHDNCGCTVTYENGRQRQNVWTKQNWEAPEKEAGADPPKVFSREEALRLQAEHMPRVLTGEAESGILDIAIDDFVPCLKDAKTGEILQTEVRPIARAKLSHFTEANGWGIDWIKRSPRELTLGVFLRGDDEPQGLVSLRKDKGGIYVSFASAAPQNNKLLNDGKQQYIGVGGHLFAAAVEESIKSGYNGCIYGFAANKKLLDHYVNKFGAVHLPIAHEYQFVIDGEAAKRLIETYNFERK